MMAKEKNKEEEFKRKENFQTISCIAQFYYLAQVKCISLQIDVIFLFLFVSSFTHTHTLYSKVNEDESSNFACCFFQQKISFHYRNEQQKIRFEI